MIGAMELQPDDGLISSFSIGSGFGQCSGISPEFARRFVEGIGKLTGNISEDHRKKTRRLTARIPEATRLAGVNRSYPGVRAAELPRSTGKSPIPDFFGYV
ncbi:hypothetical protein BHE74_00028910 [Ensete ventricosum]|nr:hypothetical protein BHE74_00028910 [Ensete ventricosum]